MRSQDHLSRRELLTSGLFCATAAGVSLSFAALAPSSQARRMLQERRFRVLMITYRGATDVDHGFRRYLLDAGLDVEFIARDVKQDASQVAHILDELPTLAPDLIYTWGTPVTLAVAGTTDHPNAHPALLNIPIVFALVAEPQKAGIVRNLSAPERNVTGAIHIVPLPQQLQHMRNYRAFDKLGVLYNADEANSQAMVQSLKQYGEQHGVKILARSLHPHSSGKPEASGLEELIDEIAQAGAQWLYLPPDTYLGTIYERITPLAMARKLPLFASTELAMRTGNALTGLVSRYDSVGQLAGSQALDLLLGKKNGARDACGIAQALFAASQYADGAATTDLPAVANPQLRRSRGHGPQPRKRVMKNTPPSVSCAQLSQRELRQDDLPAIHALHLRSTQGLDNEMVRQESLESLSQQMERSHFLGKFHQDELIAYGVLQHTLTEAERLPQHIASDAAQPQLILAGISVAPEWRGQGLQRRLIMLRTAMAPANALLFSTAAPANWYSWNNLLAWDFHVRALIPFCEGHVRYLMVRQALPAHCIFPDLSKEFHSLDIKRQQALLETGWRGAQPGHDPRYLRYVPVDKGVA